MTVNSSQTLVVGVSSASFAALDNTTYYFKVKVSTMPDSDYSAPITTITASATPTTIVFDDVSTTTIVASAYAPSPAFSNLDRGQSGINVARDAAYAGYRTGNVWTAKAAMPTARSGPAATALNSRLYVAGGSGGAATSLNHYYDPMADAWVARASLATTRYQHGLRAIGDRLYAVGGYNGSNLSGTEEYDPLANTWTGKASMPTARYGFGFGTFNGKFYAAGGWNGSPLAVNEEYNPATNAWTARAAMPTARRYVASSQANGRMYVVGGSTRSDSLAPFQAANEEYDPVTDAWVAKAAMPTARESPAAGSLGGKVYVVGGWNGADLAVTEEYDPLANAWAARASMPTTSKNPAVAAVRGRLYALGGENGAYLATNQEYDPGVSQEFTGLTPNTLYAFKTKARNSVGAETPESLTVSTYTLAAVPSGLSATMIGAGSAALAWGANGNPASTLYQLERSTGTAYIQIYSTNTALSFTDTGLAPQSTYHYRVRAVSHAEIPTVFTSSFTVVTGSLPPGCGVGFNVKQSGGADHATIQAAVNALPKNLSATACVVIRDDGTYGEQVTLEGFTSNGYALKVLADPSFVSSGPVITPPALSTAAFLIKTASVTLTGLYVLPASSVPYGVLASSDYATLDRLTVSDGSAALYEKALSIRSYSSVIGSSVSVHSRGLQISGTLNTVIGSTLTSKGTVGFSTDYPTVYLENSSSVTIAGSKITTVKSLAIYLTGSTHNSIVFSTAVVLDCPLCNAISFGSGSSTNTIADSYASGNTASPGIYLGGSGHHTVVRSTAITLGGGVGTLSVASNWNTIANNRLLNPSSTGKALYLEGSFNTVSQNELTGGGRILEVYNAAYNTFSGNTITGPGTFDGQECAYLRGDYNTYSQMTVNCPGNYATAVRFYDGGDNTLSNVYGSAPAGTALKLRVDRTTVDQSTFVSNCGNNSASFGFCSTVFVEGSSNTISRSFLSNPAGFAYYLSFYPTTTNNTVSQSTITSAASGYFPDPFGAPEQPFAAVNLRGGHTTRITDSYISNTAGAAVYIGSPYNTISLSTISAAAPTLAAVIVSTYGSPAVTSTGTHASLLGTVITGPSARGIQLHARVGGAPVAIATVTFRSLLPGATAVAFVSDSGVFPPTFVATFTAVDFADATIGANVEAGALGTSRITMRGATGARAGPAHENDPGGYVDWPSDASLLPSFATEATGVGDLWPSMARDRFGDLHVAYFGSGVRYLKRTGSSWGASTLVESITGGGAASISIAVDLDGNPRIAYVADGSPDLLRYAAWNGSTWTLQTAASYATISGPSLALDAAGLPRLVYTSRAGSDSIRYARFDGASWIDEAIEDVPAGSGETALALDGAGVPHAGYAGRYARRDGGAWTFTTVDSNAHSESLALDENAGAHIVYHEASTGSFRYREPSGSTTTIISSSRGSLLPTAIALDGARRPHVALMGCTALSDGVCTGSVRLEYGRLHAGLWSTSIVDTTGSVGSHPSLELGYGGEIHLVYSRLGTTQIKAAHADASSVVAPVRPPTGFNGVALGTTSISWRWTASASELGYRLYGATSAAGPFSLLVGTATLGPGATHFVETLPAGATYFRYVAAVAVGGVATSSGSLAAPAPPGPPLAPSAFAGTALSPNSVRWSWSDHSSDETGFRVMSGTTNLSGDLPAQTTSWTQLGLSTNTPYGPYLVRAFNGFGAADSGSASRHTAAATPTDLAAGSIGPTSALLSWQGGSNPPGTVWELYQSTSGGVLGSQVYASSAAASFGAGALSPTTTYYFRVRSLNGDGVASAASDPVDLWTLPAQGVLAGPPYLSPAISTTTVTGLPALITAFGPIAVNGAAAYAAATIYESSDTGPTNFWIGKVDHLLRLVSTQTSTAWGVSEWPTAIALDPSGNVWLASKIQDGDGFQISKFDANLVLLQQYSWIGGAPDAAALAPDPSGAMWVAGTYRPASDAVLFLMKLAATGLYESSATFTQATGAQSLALDAGGSLLVTGCNRTAPLTCGQGHWIGKVSPSYSVLASTISARLNNGQKAFVTADAAGDVWAAGNCQAGDCPTGDILIQKYDSSLVFLSSRTYGGSAGGFDRATGIAAEPSGGVWISGSVEETGQSSNGWVGRFGPSLVLLSSGSMDGGGAGYDAFDGLALDPSRNPWVAGAATNAAAVTQNVVARIASASAPPLAPSGFDLLDATVSSVLWRWADNATNETGYRVLLGTQNVSGDLPANTTTWNQVGLSTNATVGALLAQAFNGNGTADSNLRTGYARATPPFGLTATAIHVTSVTLSWQPSSNPPWTTWILDQSTVAPIVGFPHVLVSSGPTTFTVTGLTPATSYYFEVYANNANGIATARSTLSAVITRSDGTGVRTWTGLGASTRAAEAANWSGSVLPVDGDSVLFSSASSKTCSWDLPPLSLSSFSILSGYSGYVAVSSNVSIGRFYRESGSLCVPCGSTVTVAGAFINTGAGGIQFGNGRLRLRGDVTLDAAGSSASQPGIVELAGPGPQLVTGWGNVSQLEFTSPGEVKVQGAPYLASFGVRLSTGRVDFTGTGELAVQGDWTQTGGQFIAGGSTVAFILGTQGSPRLVSLLAGNPFAGLRIGAYVSGPFAGHVRAASPLETTGDLMLSSGSFDAGVYLHRVGGDFEHTGGGFDPASGTIRLAGGRNASVLLQPGAAFRNLEIAPFCSTCSVSALSDVTVNGYLMVSSGTWSPGAFTHRLRGDVVADQSGSMLAGSGTTIFDGSSPQRLYWKSSNRFYNLTVANPAGLSLPGAAPYLTLDGSLAIEPGALLDATDDDVRVWWHFTSSGTYLAPRSTTNLLGVGPQTLYPNGAAFGTLFTCNGSTTTILGSFSADTWHCTVTGSLTRLAAGSTVTAGGIYFGLSNPASPVRLRSTLPGSPWHLNLTGAAPYVHGIDVQDSDASAGNPIPATFPTNVDSGNNRNWIFAGGPPPATGFAGTALGPDRILWSWNDVAANEAGYRVMSVDAPASPDLPAGTTSWLQTGLGPNGLIGPYRVQGFNAGGATDSSTASARTFAATPTGMQQPVARHFLAPASTRTEVDVRWSTGVNPAGTTFEVYRSTSGLGGPFSFWASTRTELFTDVGTEASSCKLAQLAYQVRAVNGDGIATALSAASNLNFVPAPAAPSGVEGTAVSTGAIRWSWEDNACNELGYRVLAGTVSISGDLAPGTTAWVELGFNPNQRALRWVQVFGTGSTWMTPGPNRSSLAEAPSSLAVTAVSSLTATLSWSGGANAPGIFYELERSTGGPFTAAAGVAATSAIDRGLAPATAYQWRVRALNSDLIPSAYSATASSATASIDVPETPTGFAGLAVSTDRVLWTWRDVSFFEQGFRVLSGTVSLSGDLPPGSTSWLQRGLSPNRSYGPYSVRAFNTSGASDSAPASRFTLADPAAAFTPVEVGSTSILLSWQGNGNPAATEYELRRSTGGAYLLLGSTFATTYRDGGLAPLSLYSYQLRPKNGDGLYAAVFAATAAVTIAQGAPAAPTDFSGAALAATRARWTWADNASGELGYRVVSGAINLSGNLPPNTTSWTQGGLSTNTLAGPFKVQAFNSGGVSESAAASVFTLAATPSDFFARSVSTGGVVVGWTPNGNPAGTRYRVAIATFAGGGTLEDGAAPAALERGFGGLAAGATYYFEGVAVSSAGFPSAAAQTSARTSDLSAPAAPTAFAGSPLAPIAILWTWTDNASDELGVRVLAGGTNLSGDLPAQATSWLQTGLTPNTRYGPYLVRAFGAGGTADSGFAARATPAAPPASLTAGAVSSTTVSLTWSAEGNPAGTLYRVERSTGTGYVPVANPAAAAATVAGLSPSTAYLFRVRAVGSEDGTATEPSAAISVVTSLPGAPSAPVALGAVAVSRSAVRWSWTLTSSNEVAVRLKQGSTNVSGDLPARTAVWLQTGLSTNTLAGPLIVEAINAGGAAASTAPVSRYSLAAPPVSLAAVAVASTTVSLSWSANTNPAGTPYEVHRSSGSGFALAGTVSSTGFADLGLASQTTYQYQVRALNGDGSPTLFSRVVVATTPRPAPPAAPAGFHGVAQSAGSILWTWSDNSTDEAGFRVLGAGANLSSELPAGTTSWLQTGLSTNTATGPLQVQAYNAGGASLSAAATRFTQAASPTRLEATGVSSASISLAWLANENPGGTVYQIQRATTAAFALLATQAATAYTDTAVLAGGAYQYRVRALNGDGVASAFSDALALKANDASAPNPPSGFSGRAVSSASLEWSWLDNAVGELGYRVMSGTTSVSGDLAPGTTVWLQAGLAAGAAYGPYKAQAFNLVGEANSGTATRSTLPSAPTGLAAVSVSSVSTSLAWTSPGAGLRFQLERSTDATFAAVWTGEGQAAENRLLSPASTYTYRVRAINPDGLASAYSDALLVQTLAAAPATPASLAGAGASASSVRWTWTAVAGAAGYRLYYATSPASLAGSAAAPEFVQTGLAPNEPARLTLAALNATGEGERSAAASAHALADVPGDLAAVEVHATSAAFSWSMGANAGGTRAELEVSEDGATWRRAFLGAAVSRVVDGLAACRPASARVRALSGDSVATEYSAPVSFTTRVEEPLPPGRLAAESLEGNRIRFQWGPSPSEGVVGYRLYYDGGSGAIDYVLPLAVLAATETSWTSGVLVSSPAYRFGLRAVNRCGAEDSNRAVLASAASLNSLSGVRAAIKVPDSGKRVAGNRVTIVAEIVLGDDAQVRSVLFQYKPSADSAWLDVRAANANHPNPDRVRPWVVHLDADALAPGSYDLRAVAIDFGGNADATPPAISVTVDPQQPDISESSQGGGNVQKEQKINNGGTSTVRAADEGSTQVSEVTIPPGALDASTVTVKVTNNPVDVPPVSRKSAKFLSSRGHGPRAADDDVEAAGAYVEITLSNGQSQLAAGKTAAVTISYADADDNGIVDGTTLKAKELAIWVYDPAGGEWRKESNSVVDRGNRTVTGQTPHFSLFGLFANPAHAALSNIRVYPNPFKPNGGDPDQGRPYALSDPNSGVVFENLPPGAAVTIYTVSGRRVRRLSADAGGRLQWDARNEDGRDVATGGYLAVVTSPGQQTASKVVAIIR